MVRIPGPNPLVERDVAHDCAASCLAGDEQFTEKITRPFFVEKREPPPFR
jgi:hypothetical protein